MLKQINPLISPDLIHILMSMGHGDELIIADGNFPAQTFGKRVIYCKGNTVLDVLQALTPLLPLDQYSQQNASVMAVVPGDPTVPTVWSEFETELAKDPSFTGLSQVERFAFYERAKEAYAVISTSDTALYGNLLIKKGVVK